MASLIAGGGRDPACYLWPSVALSHELNTCAVFSRTTASSESASWGQNRDKYPEYDDGLIKMASNTWHEAEYCLISGFFDIPDPDALLQSNEALQQRTQQTCNALPEGLIDSVTLTQLDAAWSRMLVGLAESATRPAGQQTPFMNVSEAQIHNAAFCAIGAMDCVLYWCLDFYCKLPDGRIGSGCQCRSDYTYGMPL